jgi:hypothetical protein
MPTEHVGPEYPRELGATVAKFRRMAKSAGGVSEMLPQLRRAYGNAVSAAIRRKQRSEFMRASVEPGTRTEPIGAARRAAMRARLLAYPSQVRRARTDKQWRDMYERAMREKRAAAQSAVIVIATRRPRRGRAN